MCRFDFDFYIYYFWDMLFFFKRTLTIYVYVNCVLRHTFTVHDYSRSLSWPGPVRSGKPWYRFSTVTAGLRRSRYYRNNCVTFIVYSNNSAQNDIRCNTIKSNPQSDFSCRLNFVNFDDLLTQRSAEIVDVYQLCHHCPTITVSVC